MDVPIPGDGEHLLTVLLVNWNGMKWLKRCLDTLQAQTYKNVEIVVVDNASSDSSVAFLLAHYPQVRLLQNSENLGFAGGNNAGMGIATGEWILLLNTDTWVEPELVEELLTEIRNRRLDVIGPMEANYWTGEKRTPYSTHIDVLGHPTYISPPHPTRSNFYLTGVCLLFSRQLYYESGGFDSTFFMYCEEVDWFWRLNMLGKVFDYSQSQYVYHACGGSLESGVNVKTFRWRNENTLQMLIKNYSSLNLAWVLPLYFAQNFVEIVFFSIKFEFKIAKTYFAGWWFNLVHLRGIIGKRRAIQLNRSANDSIVMRKMFLGSGKLRHLLGENYGNSLGSTSPPT
jgi:GT2 family glycosyltransferase